VRSIEDVLRIKKRKLDELQREINTLEAAALIMDAEVEPAQPLQTALERAADAMEPRGIPNIPNVAANPMATQPPPKRWP